MSVLRYCKEIQPYEVPDTESVLDVIRATFNSPTFVQYLYAYHSLSPVRNHAPLSIHHNRLKWMRWK